jgi:hypothetical protein
MRACGLSQAADVGVHTKPKVPGTQAHHRHACRSCGTSNLSRLAHAAALPPHARVHIARCLALSQIIDGSCELMGHHRQGLPWAIRVLQAPIVFLPCWVIDQAQDGGF